MRNETQTRKGKTMTDIAKLNVRLRTRRTQATRKEESRNVEYWDVETPQGWVAVGTIEEAREVAGQHGTTILL